ncbi:MAG TPA: hypothetical protein VGF40_04990 [Thermoanaerobaculia bacterium]
MRWIPTPAEERALALRGRARRWLRAGWITAEERRRIDDEGAGSWKVFPALGRLAIFFLTFNAASMARFLIGIRPSLAHVAVGLAMIALAELLIVRGRFFRTGIEEGIWCAGLSALLFDVFALAESSMLFAAWFALAAGIAALLLSFRLLHTLLFLVALAILAFWASDFFASTSLVGWMLVAAGAGALAIHLMPARRPFRASASGWLALLAPVAAWALVRDTSLSGAWGIAAGCAAAWIAAGIRWRSRFALAGGALAGAAFGFELLESQPLAVEWKLILGGIAGLALALALLRWLREPRGGFTSQALDSDAEPRLFELAAVAAIAPATAAPREEGLSPGEGKFGGGGASGEY